MQQSTLALWVAPSVVLKVGTALLWETEWVSGSPLPAGLVSSICMLELCFALEPASCRLFLSACGEPVQVTLESGDAPVSLG